MNIGGANGVEGEFEEKSPVCWAKEIGKEGRERENDYMRNGLREKERERKRNTMEGTVSEKVTAERRGWKKYSPRTIPAAWRDRARGRSREAGKTRAVKCHRAMLIYGGREIGGVKLRAEPVRPETAKFLFKLSSARLADGSR